MSRFLVPVSPGELLDKITILQIKSERIDDRTQLANVRHELNLLQDTQRRAQLDMAQVAELTVQLKAVNERLWEIEDSIRGKEAAQAFDAEFIELARAVYVTNDERAALKRRINEITGSDLVEEKSYREYHRPDG